MAQEPIVEVVPEIAVETKATEPDADDMNHKPMTCPKCMHKGPYSEFALDEPSNPSSGTCSAERNLIAALVEMDSDARSRIKTVLDAQVTADERMELDALLEV